MQAALLLASSLLLGCGSGTVGPGLVLDSGIVPSDEHTPANPQVVPTARADAGVRETPDAMPSAELCDNQLDDDQDGQVDENCACDPTRNGGQQSCYPGPAATRGVGICRAGTQRCVGDQEFKAWGVCTAPVTPGVELSGDRLDNDCDGDVDEGGSEPAPTCGNGALNYPSCTTDAAGNCLNRNINPPECTTPQNRPPNPPVLNVPTSVEADTAFEARFTATDPDGDALRYGFDATADGIVDTWYPATGYVASGSTETRPWRLNAGTFTFQVLAQDSKGMSSAWAQHTITVTPPACPALGPQETRVLNAGQLDSRALRGENVRVFAGGAGTSVLVSRGAQAEVASAFGGLSLYFEGPAAEYALSSGGNVLTFVDRCGRTTRIPVQGPLTVAFYFSDGNFGADNDSAQHRWHLSTGSGHLYFDALTENLSDVQATLKANLRAGSSQGRF